jgi:outer membrane protein assembly factor BamB
MFDLATIPYAMLFGNYQRNSYVPLETYAQGKLLWSKQHVEHDPEAYQTPQAVLLNGTCLGLQTASQFWLLDLKGGLKKRLPIAGSSPLIFGKDGFAFLDPIQMLAYADCEGKILTQSVHIYGTSEWTSVLLLRPLWEEVISVVQFSGGPRRSPRQFFSARMPIGKTQEVWSFDGPGTVDHALMTGDEKKLLLIRGAQVTVLDLSTGAQAADFKLPVMNARIASLDLQGNLVVVGQKAESGAAAWMLYVLGLDGSNLWQRELSRPVCALDAVMRPQPPASGPGGRVYLIEDGYLTCHTKDAEKWRFPVIGPGQPHITVAKDGAIILINTGFLNVIDPEGKAVFSKLISTPDEAFDAPAVLDEQGRIYVAGSKAIYCFE